MRCPKCGFISFDNLEKCLKCNKELKDVAGLMHGTVFQVLAPSYLKIPTGAEVKDFGEDIEIIGGTPDGDFDLQDPDLEILFDEEAEVADDSSSMRLEKDSGDLEVISSADFDAAKDEDDGQISIDLGQFRNDLDDKDSGLEDIFSEGKDERLSLELPDGLTDISDLAPPQKKMTPPPLQKSSDLPQSGDDFNFDLDLDLDLDLGGLDEKLHERPPVKTKKVENFSLDEIDLSTTRPTGTPRKGDSDAMNMDEELNFDLDLGGLSIHKD
jgi:hypothetical protein